MQNTIIKAMLFIVSILVSCEGKSPKDYDTLELSTNDIDSASDDMEETKDITTRRYDADDERIQYTGRIDFTDPQKPRFSAAATYIKIRFRGIGLSIIMKDEIRYNERQNFMDVLIDNREPFVIEPDMSMLQTNYPVDVDLEYGEHEVTVVKRTQAENGQVMFLGFEIQGELLDPLPRREKRIQIIGDSISAGEGTDVEKSSDCTNNWIKNIRYQNARLGFGPVLAERLDAEYHVIAWSGKGLYQNNTDKYDARLMPELYNLLYMERNPSSDWNHALYIPDAIIIELGTNDFGPGDSSEESYPRPSPDKQQFAEAYIAFVDSLIALYPEVQIFALSSHLLTDGWPDASDTRKSDLEDALTLIDNNYKTKNIDQIHIITVSHVAAKGCDYHPNKAQHEQMADELETKVREIMKW